MPFLINFWWMFHRFWAPRWLKNRSKIDIDTKTSKLWKLRSRLHESSTFEDLRALKSFKIWRKTVKKTIKNRINFLIDFLINFGSILGSKIDQKPSKNRWKIDWKIIKKSDQILISIFIEFTRFGGPCWAVLGGFSAVFLRFFCIFLHSCWLPGPRRPQDPSKKASGPILLDFWPIFERYLFDFWLIFEPCLVEFW